MVISFVGIPKHTTASAFSWLSDNLDKVVALGDEVCTHLGIIT